MLQVGSWKRANESRIDQALLARAIGSVALLIANGAHAADIRTYPVERFGYRATHVVLEGDIVPGDAARLADVIASAPVVSDIELYSRGGDLTEAIALSDELVRAVASNLNCAGPIMLEMQAEAQGEALAPSG